MWAPPLPTPPHTHRLIKTSPVKEVSSMDSQDVLEVNRSFSGWKLAHWVEFDLIPDLSASLRIHDSSGFCSQPLSALESYSADSLPLPKTSSSLSTEINVIFNTQLSNCEEAGEKERIRERGRERGKETENEGGRERMRER